MSKKVYRYFWDFLFGQEKWLNKMAEDGYRLVNCYTLSYEFEECAPCEYEYAVAFIGEKSLSAASNYKDFLRSRGYHVFTKNINLNYSFGKVTWRPWAKGWGQIAASPGAYNRELLIVEKKADGTPFVLHKNRNETISMYRSARSVYIWGLTMILFLLALTLSNGCFRSFG